MSNMSLGSMGVWWGYKYTLPPPLKLGIYLAKISWSMDTHWQISVENVGQVLVLGRILLYVEVEI